MGKLSASGIPFRVILLALTIAPTPAAVTFAFPALYPMFKVTSNLNVDCSATYGGSGNALDFSCVQQFPLSPALFTLSSAGDTSGYTYLGSMTRQENSIVSPGDTNLQLAIGIDVDVTSAFSISPAVVSAASGGGTATVNFPGASRPLTVSGFPGYDIAGRLHISD